MTTQTTPTCDVVLVPREPTEEMIREGCHAYGNAFLFINGGSLGEGIAASYKAMLSAASVTDQGWRSIETAPKDGTPVLAYAKGYMIPFVSWWGFDAYEKGDVQVGGVGHTVGRHWCVAGCEDGDSIIYDPTHWQPLPELPNV